MFGQYKNLSMMPPSTVNGVPINDIIGTPAPDQPKPKKDCSNFKFIQDFKAEGFNAGKNRQPGQAYTMQYIEPKQFKKGMIVEGCRINGRVLLDGKLDITDGVVPYSQAEQKSEEAYDPTIFAPIAGLIGVGLLVIGIPKRDGLMMAGGLALSTFAGYLYYPMLKKKVGLK